MKHFRTTAIIATSIVATLALASVTGFQLNEIVAEETEDNGYKFAENVKITAEFIFQAGPEIAQFQVYQQDSGFDFTDRPSFRLEKISNGTPLLYAAADEARLHNRGSSPTYNYKEFDVNIILSRDGDVIRLFKYETCRVDDYSVETEYDKEEGYFGKGFAVVDRFEISCNGYEPLNPQYAQMTNNYPKANSMNSINLKEPTETWENHPKYQSKGFGK